MTEYRRLSISDTYLSPKQQHLVPFQLPFDQRQKDKDSIQFVVSRILFVSVLAFLGSIFAAYSVFYHKYGGSVLKQNDMHSIFGPQSAVMELADAKQLWAQRLDIQTGISWQGKSHLMKQLASFEMQQSWRQDSLGFVKLLVKHHSSVNFHQCYSLDGLNCCRVSISADIFIQSCHAQSSQELKAHISRSLELDSPQIQEWIDFGLGREIGGHFVVSDSAQPITLTEDVVIKRGINYFLYSEVENHLSLPLMFEDDTPPSNVDLDFYLPANDFTLDIKQCLFDLIVPYDKIKDQSKPEVDEFEPLPKSVRVSQKLYKRRQTVNRDNCQAGYRRIHDGCYRSDMMPKLDLDDFVTGTARSDEHDNILQYTAAKLSFKVSYIPFEKVKRKGVDTKAQRLRASSSPYSLPMINEPIELIVKTADQQSIEITINGVESKTVAHNEVVQLMSSRQGRVTVEFPAAFAFIVIVKSRFQSKGRSYDFKDGVERLGKTEPQVINELLPTEMTDADRSHVFQAFRKVLSPMGGRRRVAVRHPVGSLNDKKIHKRSEYVRIQHPRDFLHKDDEVELLLGHPDDHTDLPAFWEFRLPSNDTSAHYAEHANADEFMHRSQIVLSTASNVTLYKRNRFANAVSDFVDGFRKIKDKIEDEIYEAARNIDHFLIEKGSGSGILSLIVRGVHKVTKAVITLVIKTVRQAIDFVRGILKAVKVEFIALLDKVAEFFGLKYVADLTLINVHHMQLMSKNINELITDNFDNFIEDVDDWKSTIDEKIDQFVKKHAGKTMGELDPTGVASEYEGYDQKGKKDKYNPNSRFAADHLERHLSSKDGANQEVGGVVVPDMKEHAEQFAKQLQAHLPQDQLSQYKNHVEQNIGIFKGGFVATAVQKLGQFLKGVIHFALKVIKGVGKLVMKLLLQTFAMFHKTLNFHIKIPVLTPLFEKVIMKNRKGAMFNGYSMYALLGAFPAAIGYRLHHKRAPFTKQEIELILGTKSVQLYVDTVKQSIPSTNVLRFANALSYVFGHVYCAAHAIYSAFNLGNYLTPFPLRLLQGYVIGFSQYIMQVMQVPINWHLIQPDSSFVARRRVWIVSLLSFLFHKGNPTLLGLFMPAGVNALFQSIMAVPKLGLLIYSFVTDLIQNRELQETNLMDVASSLRYLANTADTVAQLIEFFVVPVASAIAPGGTKSQQLVQYGLQQANFFVNPIGATANLVKDVVFAVGQNIILWFAYLIHAGRLHHALVSEVPFLT